VGRCYGNPLMPDMIKARKDIAATHKKRTRFQSTPGHFKRIGRNLSIPTEETRRCTFQLSGVLKKITEEATACSH